MKADGRLAVLFPDVTITSAGPAFGRPGTRATRAVPLWMMTLVAAVPPTVTTESAPNPAPEMITSVVLVVLPDTGDTVNTRRAVPEGAAGLPHAANVAITSEMHARRANTGVTRRDCSVLKVTCGERCPSSVALHSSAQRAW